MLDKVHDGDLVPGHFLDHDVEVLPISILLVKDKGSSEGAKFWFMLELTSDLAGHFWVIPAMDTLSDMGLVGGVLEIVHQLLSGSLLEEVGMEENDILGFYCGVDHEFGFIDLINPVDRSLLTFKVTGSVCDVRTHKSHAQGNCQVTRVICREQSIHLESCVVNFGVFFPCEDDCHLLSTGHGLVDIHGVWWNGSDNDFLGLADHALVDELQLESCLIDLEQCQPCLIYWVDVIELRVKVNVNFGAVVVNDLVRVHVSPWTFSEDPSVVNFIRDVLIVSHIGLTLDNNVLAINLDIFYCAVLWDGVLIDDLMFEHVLPTPVDFVDVVFVGQTDDQLVLKIVAVHWELLHTGSFQLTSDQEFVIFGDIQPVKPYKTVQKVNISVVHF